MEVKLLFEEIWPGVRYFLMHGLSWVRSRNANAIRETMPAINRWLIASRKDAVKQRPASALITCSSMKSWLAKSFEKNLPTAYRMGLYYSLCDMILWPRSAIKSAITKRAKW